MTSLNDKLKNVKWGEFILEEIFDSSNGNFDIQKEHINGKGNYVITAGFTNNGILGKTDVPFYGNSQMLLQKSVLGE